jgi:DNA-binding response OmpR family regulator
MNPGTVLVIDDQRDLAEAVERALGLEGFDVIIATDGKSGLSIAREHAPDLVILDLTMPGIDGLEVCRRLRADPKRGRMPILVLSARASEADRVVGLETGADDYVIKPFGARELVARVKALLRRTSAAAPARPIITSGSLKIDLHQHRVTYEKQEVALTAAEFRVLEFLAREPGRVFSRDEVIEGALHSDAAITERTVDAHIAGIRKKLGPGADQIETVRAVGYRFVGENDE